MAANHEALYGFKREPGLLAQRKCRINNWVDDDAARIGLIGVLCELHVSPRPLVSADQSIVDGASALKYPCRPSIGAGGPLKPRSASNADHNPFLAAFPTLRLLWGAQAFNETTGLRCRRTYRPYHAFCVER